MEFYKILQEIMDEKSIGVADVARLCGLTDSTVRSIIDREQKKVALNVAFKLSDGLGVSLERLNGGIKTAPSLPDEALKVARDYNGLDTHGKSMTRLVISEEQKRMDEEAKQTDRKSTALSNVLPFVPKQKTTHKGMVTIEVYEEPSAAGTGNYVSDTPASHMEQYPEEDIHSQTDFGVVISGRSMEPKYPDKAVVFVKSTQVVEPGEVGIFLLDGQTYIKQLLVDPETGTVSLHSLNPEFADIPVTPYADFRPQGKVLGGYDPGKGRAIWK